MQPESNPTRARASPGRLAHALVHLMTVLYSLSVSVGPVSLYASPPRGSICLTAELIPAISVAVIISISPFPLLCNETS